ncbi:MAG TPA: hypothetical protein VFA80_03725 [Xanthobacteraceae bacterium]|jgi:hypothetical protein|nr:hypothetical protein [Xanthobacteraceae bacterium]
MTILRKALAGAALATGTLAFSALNASAAIVCRGDVCWHTHDVYRYPSSEHIIVHRDNWRAGPRVIFREHEGPGYWRGDSWVGIGVRP